MDFPLGFPFSITNDYLTVTNCQLTNPLVLRKTSSNKGQLSPKTKNTRSTSAKRKLSDDEVKTHLSNLEEPKLHLNQTANVRPRITEPVQFITSSTAENAKTGVSSRSSNASNLDSETNIETVLGDMIQDVLETPFHADNEANEDPELNLTNDPPGFEPPDEHRLIEDPLASESLRTSDATHANDQSEYVQPERSHKKSSPMKNSPRKGRWTTGFSPTKGARGKGGGKGDRRAPELDIDFENQKVIDSPTIADLLTVIFTVAPGNLEKFIHDPHHKEQRLPDGSFKTHEYRINSLSINGYGSNAIITQIQKHLNDAGITTEITRIMNSIKPPWRLQAKIKQEDRTNFYLYLELLHRQDHTITMNMKDEKGQKQNVDFRITAELVDRSLSNEMMATFTAKWPERKDWKVTYAHELQFIADTHHRRHGAFSPIFLTGKDPENPYELAPHWNASRAVNWSKMSSGMAIPTKINQMTFSIPTRYFENRLCEDLNLAIPTYARIKMKNINTHEEKVVRADIMLTGLTRATPKQACQKGRGTHDLGFSKLHGIPYKPNTDLQPCLWCKHNEKTHCLRCFDPFGSRGETQTEISKYHEMRDERDCFLEELEQLAIFTRLSTRTCRSSSA